MFIIQKPEGYLWEYPGFPSLFVPYTEKNDFFYSGHLGSCTLVMLEARHMEFRWLQIFAACGIVVELVLMTSLRAHYIIDLVSGMVFAHYFFILTRWYVHLVDKALCGVAVDQKQEEMNPDGEAPSES